MIKVALWYEQYQWEEGREPSKIMTLVDFARLYNKEHGFITKYKAIKFIVAE